MITSPASSRRQGRGPLRRVFEVVALVTMLALAGCTSAEDRATQRLEPLISDLDLPSAGVVVAEGWTSEGIGDSLVHYRAVFADRSATAELIQILDEAGFEPAAPPEDNPEVLWGLDDEQGNIGASLRLLAPGDSVDLGGGETFTADDDSVAIDFYTVG